MKNHSGVAVRLLAGLSIMAILAVTASLVGHFAVDGYKEPFRQTVSIDLPSLVATSRLAQDAFSLTANAPALVQAKSQAARRDAMARIEDQVEGMKGLVNRFPDSDVAVDTVQYVVAQGGLLFDTLKLLDQRIDERLTLDRDVARSTEAMRRLGQAITDISVSTAAEADALRGWQVAAQHVLILLALAASTAQPTEIGALEDETARGLADADRWRGALSAETALRVGPLGQRLEELCRGDASLTKLKSRSLAITDEIGTLLNRNKVLSDEMAGMVASVISSIEGNALRRSAAVIRSSERHSLLLLAIAIICVASAVIVILYINQNIIRRLRELVACMMSAVKGNYSLSITTSSDDEIGELARAFQYFVATIQIREAALRASERRLADIINLLPDATVVIDLEGTVLFWNRAMEHLCGVPAAEMVGRGNYEYAVPFYGARRPILVDMALKPDAFIPGAYSFFEPHGDTIWAETCIPSLRGREVWLRGSASVVRDAEGTVVGAIETIFDITERRHMIENLRMAKEAAERASQAKSLFLATMSHELRTPLNAMIGFSDFVATEIFGPVGDRQYIEHAEYARQSAHHLLDIINGMLDLSKIEAGMVKLESVWVPVLPIVKRSIRMVQDLALSAGVTIRVAIPATVPDLWADERAMRQILINLLGNAIKFNVDGGGILVTALETEDGIEIVVADTGSGIPAADLDRIRKPFEQIDNQYSRAQGGTGLGLSIVEGLVNLHGAVLSIASVVGKGTAVTIRFPPARRFEGTA